jgi:hypothetical protein
MWVKFEKFEKISKIFIINKRRTPHDSHEPILYINLMKLIQFTYNFKFFFLQINTWTDYTIFLTI